jgi:hypothetical protein
MNAGRIFAFLFFLLGAACTLALPPGWERTDDEDGTVSFRHPGESKVVTFADLKSSSGGRTFDFKGKMDIDKFRILSSILHDLGYCTDRAVYDTALYMLYCRGSAKDDSGKTIPVIAYVKMEDERLLLILGFYNASRRDILDLIDDYSR